MAGTLLKFNTCIIYCLKLDLNPWIYPSTRDTRTYPYPCGRVGYSAGMGTGRTPDTRGYTHAIHYRHQIRSRCLEKLVTEYEKDSATTCMALRQQFYSLTHDPTVGIAVFIDAVFSTNS
jgi:hypothetical protein